MAIYIDRPGIDKAEIISDGRVYPVVMSIPISGSSSEDGEVSSGSALGFNIPEYDSITTIEDSNGKLKTVLYTYDGNSVGSLSFSYVEDANDQGIGTPYVFVAPYKATTIAKGA